MIFVPLCDDVKAALKHGRTDGGGLPLRSERTILEITPHSGWSSSSYDVVILGLKYRQANLRGNDVSIEDL